jgi:hypothetical protein
MCPSVSVAIFSSNSRALTSEKHRKIEAMVSGTECVRFDCSGVAHDGDRLLLTPAVKFLEHTSIQMQFHLAIPFDFAPSMDNSGRGNLLTCRIYCHLRIKLLIVMVVKFAPIEQGRPTCKKNCQ